MHLFRLVVLALGILLIAPIAYASATVGSVDSAYKYAWSNVGGYVNFAPTQGGVVITDSAITGYAWSANSGYINFDTNLSGVTNDGEGNLGGFAWGEGAGWISFSGVTIGDDGTFSGTATGGTVNGASYAIAFDCANCDVRTDWRPASARASSGDSEDSSGGSSGQSQVTAPPDSELPIEPTTPPPGAPNASGEGSGQSEAAQDLNGDGMPDYPTGALANPAMPASATDIQATSTGESGPNVVVVAAGIILALLALFFLIRFFILKR